MLQHYPHQLKTEGSLYRSGIFLIVGFSARLQDKPHRLNYGATDIYGQSQSKLTVASYYGQLPAINGAAFTKRPSPSWFPTLP
jgi:hypothetical protein